MRRHFPKFIPPVFPIALFPIETLNSKGTLRTWDVLKTEFTYQEVAQLKIKLPKLKEQKLFLKIMQCIFKTSLFRPVNFFF